MADLSSQRELSAVLVLGFYNKNYSVSGTPVALSHAVRDCFAILAPETLRQFCPKTVIDKNIYHTVVKKQQLVALGGGSLLA